MMPAPAPWFFGGRSRAPRPRPTPSYRRMTPWLPVIFSAVAVWFWCVAMVLLFALNFPASSHWGRSTEVLFMAVLGAGALSLVSLLVAAWSLIAVVAAGYHRSVLMAPVIALAGSPLMLWIAASPIVPGD